MTSYVDVFDHHFREWVAAACSAWGYRPPEDAFYRRFRERLTHETLEWIGYGIEAGLILERGLQFDVAGNAAGKGPYKWFSRRGDATEPQCNWEYYVQVAFFVRLWTPCQKAGLSLTLEDGLMDLAIWRKNQLLWCIEVKERAVQIDRLLADLAVHGTKVDFESPDRGKDALRKAKYLMKHRPKFFSGVAIGLQRDFQVQYPGPSAFHLAKADPPVGALREPPAG